MNIFNALTLVFVVAKLWGQIDWSWWMVTSPTWMLWGISSLVSLYITWVKADEWEEVMEAYRKNVRKADDN